jgi:hypothetical protein
MRNVDTSKLGMSARGLLTEQEDQNVEGDVAMTVGHGNTGRKKKGRESLSE